MGYARFLTNTLFVPIAMFAVSLPAATLRVNSLDDATTPGDGLVTLREAISAANNDTTTDLGDTGSGADTIDLRGLAGTIYLNFPALDTLSEDFTILGPGANTLSIERSPSNS